MQIRRAGGAHVGKLPRTCDSIGRGRVVGSAMASEAKTPRIRVQESAADKARRALVGISVGPSRPLVLAIVGSVSVFVMALVLGYLTRN